MKIFNKKIILFFFISSLMINGCVAKNEFETKSPQKIAVASQLQKIKPTWGKVRDVSIKKKSTKDKDCIDCYAKPLDYSKPPSSTNNAFAKSLSKPVKRTSKQAKVADTKHFGDYGYNETASDTSVKTANYVKNKYVAPVVNYVNSSHGSYSLKNNTAIQVGAFRQYNGAKVYMKRYNALSNKYKVAIKTGTKNNKPLYRVRIEGFKNKNEAKKFMYSYGIRDAFVVRK